MENCKHCGEPRTFDTANGLCGKCVWTQTQPFENKSPALVEAIDSMFPSTLQSIKELKCPCCLKPITTFRDKFSIKEYQISGMCQECQDKVFGP